MNPSGIFILSTCALIPGLALTCWIHGYLKLDTVVTPDLEASKTASTISVIISACNETRNIERCVQGLMAQTYQIHEVIVVDDRSTGKTREILERLASRTYITEEAST